MTLTELRQEIQAAFQGVSLDGGMSLHDAQVADDWGKPMSGEAIQETPEGAISNDWSAVSLATQELFPLFAHLDAKGFRYYIPAFMLGVLDCYVPEEMRVISTLGSLYPAKNDHPNSGILWAYHMNQYAELSPAQKTAIAHFLHHLPALLPLLYEDQQRVEKSRRNYWHQYI